MFDALRKVKGGDVAGCLKLSRKTAELKEAVPEFLSGLALKLWSDGEEGMAPTQQGVVDYLSRFANSEQRQSR